jgi:hypothetical protein
VPPALLAIVLLGGPTAGWLLYRFVVQPRTNRLRSSNREALWVCPHCRSANEVHLRRCYRCDAEPAVEDLELIDAHPSGPRRLTPVGPGLDLGRPSLLPRPRAVSRFELSSAGWETSTIPWISEPDDESDEDEMDRATLPDIAAMTEVIEAPGRRVRPPSSMTVGQGRPATARPRRVAVAGQSAEPDDDPAA